VPWDADMMNQYGQSVARYDVLPLVTKETP
jgi:hypothetical protein